VGVGTTNFRASWDWFIRHFGFDVKILEDDTVAERMLPYTGGRPHRRHACIAVNLNGGGGLEIWQYSDRVPKIAERKLQLADLGVFAAKIRCRNARAFHSELRSRGLSLSRLYVSPDGRNCFYVYDLFGNIFQVIDDDYVFIKQKTLCGGVAGAMIGVTDMDRSIGFYCDFFGYDTVKYDVSGVQEDWHGLPGGDEPYRRVLLSCSKPLSGAFSGLFGPNTIELVQALARKGEKIYEGRFWGDPGFIQICYDVVGMDAFGKFCAENGHPFTVDSCPDGEVFDMGEASGRFVYLEDPDGTLIEVVETYEVPIARKLGLVIAMKKRDPLKRLPKVMFRAMGLFSRQKV